MNVKIWFFCLMMYVINARARCFQIINNYYWIFCTIKISNLVPIFAWYMLRHSQTSVLFILISLVTI